MTITQNERLNKIKLNKEIKKIRKDKAFFIKKWKNF